MKKYIIFATGITLILICTSFVSSNTTFENEQYISKKGPLSCNHLGYVIGTGGNCWLYEFNLSNPDELMCVCEGGSTTTYGGAITKDNKIYTTEYGTGIMWMIDPESCEWVPIGGGGSSFTALSFDPISEFLYSTDGSWLWKIDIENGEQEMIGDFGSVDFMIGLAFDTEGTLYGWDILEDTLWIIDKETADVTEVGPMGINLNYLVEGDFCKEDDILYITVIGPPPNYRYQLYECDTETGECSHIGQFPEDFELSIFVIPWINHPPCKPHNPRPMNGTTGVASGPWFTFEGCDDPDGDIVTYDIYFGYTNPPQKIISNGSSPKFDPGILEPNKTIYWKFVCWDEHGASAEGPIWQFTIPPNYSPYPARDPKPPDKAENVPVNAVLNWTGWDPNGWDELTYDVYFGLYDPPTQQTNNQTDSFYDPYDEEPMQLFENYYWKIVTWDKEGEKSEGPIWTFMTGPNCTPAPDIVGPTNGRTDVIYTYTFYTTTEEEVCFEVDWGDDSPIETHCPFFNLKYVKANHSWDKKGTYIIRARIKDEYGGSSPWGELKVTIPRKRTTSFSLLNLFLERNPLLEVFLRIMNI
jgi:hypothetical protein